MARQREEVFNARLGGLLAAQGLKAKAELITEGKFLDVLINVGDVRVALEGKMGDRRAAERDAAARLDEDLADAAIAVSYPELDDPAYLTEVDVCPVGGEWRSVNAAGLARLIRAVARGAGDIDAIVRKFRRGLQSAADFLTDDQARDAINAVNIPWSSREDVRKKPQAKDHPRLRLALLVASAALFHANLDGVLTKRDKPTIDARDETGSAKYEGGWPPAKLKDCLAATDVEGALTEAWQRILALDYKPVFESAVRVLRELPPSPATAGFARRAARAGLAAAGSLGGKRHDLLGRVFHWILSTATPTGAFYTSTAAAALLAGLAIRPEDANRFPDFTIVDPACGTGTLLVAAAERLEWLNKHAEGPSGGRDLIERVLRGYDIEAAAVQLAAVALGLMNPRVKFERMGIHHLKYGLDTAGRRVAVPR